MGHVDGGSNDNLVFVLIKLSDKGQSFSTHLPASSLFEREYGTIVNGRTKPVFKSL